jgi:hypothetical protein
MAIEKLSKWDLSVEFLLYEAAALIVGIDPLKIRTNTEPSRDNPRIYDYHKHPLIKPAVDRMTRDLLDGYDLYSAMQKGKWTHSAAEPNSQSILRTREMEIVPLKIGSWCLPLDQVTQAALDACDFDGGVYETAKFTRTELSRWLSANRLKSAYGFDLGLQTAQATAGDSKLIGARWPAHETNALTALRLATVKFWANYDPIDSNTAPFNEDVAEWLVKEHHISATLANSMATISRADGLKKGPRPK